MDEILRLLSRIPTNVEAAEQCVQLLRDQQAELRNNINNSSLDPEAKSGLLQELQHEPAWRVLDHFKVWYMESNSTVGWSRFVEQMRYISKDLQKVQDRLNKLQRHS